MERQSGARKSQTHDMSAKPTKVIKPILTEPCKVGLDLDPGLLDLLDLFDALGLGLPPELPGLVRLVMLTAATAGRTSRTMHMCDAHVYISCSTSHQTKPYWRQSSTVMLWYRHATGSTKAQLQYADLWIPSPRVIILKLILRN